jgi:hypothetical protein
MKMKKTMSALALVLGLTAAAQAQNVYITGSTAFRAQIFNALGDLSLTVQQGGTSGNNSFTFTGTVEDATSGGALNLSQFSGLAGSVVNVYCNFSGSAEGVDDLISPQPNAYLSVGSSGTFTSSQIDLAFSDVSQNSTPDANSSDQLNEVQLAADASRKPFTGIAVQPFAFVVDGNASAIKNITQENFHDLFQESGGGTMPITFFTGSGSTSPVYAVGRYNLSGTRITAVLDDQYGLPASALGQWALTANGTTTPGLASTDPNSPPSNGTNWLYVTNNGYFSGGNVGKAIHAASVNGAPAALAYIGWSDAAKLTGTSNEAPINWNGQVPWIGGTYPTAGGTGGTNLWNVPGVENGSYTFWTYERLFITDADSTSPTWYSTAFAPGLIDAVQYEITHTAGVLTPQNQTAVLESQMSVYRSNDGSDVVHY